MPCTHVFTSRFGGLAEAYKRIGFNPLRNLAYVDRDRALTPIRREFVIRVVGTLTNFGASVKRDARGQLLTINENSIFVRLAPGNETILDYFCVPASGERRAQITVSPKTPPPRDIQQFDDLGFLQDLARWGRRQPTGVRAERSASSSLIGGSKAL
jgi:hypothetical protein